MSVKELLVQIPLVLICIYFYVRFGIFLGKEYDGSFEDFVVDWLERIEDRIS